MCFQEVYTDIHSLDHIQEVSLEHERVSRRIEHPSSLFQLLEIL